MIDPLIARACDGDRAALEALLAQQAPAIYRFSLRMCRNLADAEDTLQETLVAIAQHLPEFAGRSSLSSWVFALPRSACARRRRGSKNRPTEDLAALPEPAASSLNPEEAAADRQLSATLIAALDGLSTDHREVILLRDVEGLSAAEAAETLGLSEGALKSRLHRARQALREALIPALEAESPVRGPACPDIVAAWSRKLEDELSSSDCAAMERHLRECPGCGAICATLKQVLSACRRVGDAEVPPGLQFQVRRALRRFTTETTT